MSFTEFLAVVPRYKTARMGKKAHNPDPQSFIELRPIFFNPEIEAMIPKPWQPAPRSAKPSNA
jgi:hypothetical protein